MRIDGLRLDGKCIAHMAFDTFHQSKHEYKLTAPGNEHDGLVFYSESRTKKRRGEFGKWGKTTTIFYIPATLIGEEFKSLEELLNSIGFSLEDFKNPESNE